jgi:hypothetical protein
MPYLIVAGFVILFVLILAGCGRGKAGDDGKPPEPKPAPVTSGETPAPKETLTRAELQQRLATLAKTLPPTDLKPGAMCYEMAAPPTTVDYVCPKCGEKTNYAQNPAATEDERTQQWRVIEAIQTDLPRCRTLLRTIAGLHVELDEAQFCRKCSPDVKTPQLALVVKYPGEKEPHRVSGVTGNDLKLITEFLAGKTKHVGAQDFESALVKHAKRLEELLGVKAQ